MAIRKSALLLGTILAAAVAGGQAHAQSAPSAFTTGLRYDADRRLVGTIAPDPDGSGPLHYAAVRNSYDPAGRLVCVEKGELAQWQSEAVAPSVWSGFTVLQTADTSLDAMGRKLSESLSAGGTTLTLSQSSYDNEGRLSCVAVRMNPAAFAAPPPDACALGPAGIYGADRIVRNSYDLAGQLLKVTEGYGTSDQADEKRLTYTPNGKTASLTDAENNMSSFDYDPFDRLLKLRFPVPAKGALTSSTTDYEQYGYDPAGNRTSLRKRGGQVIFYSYDALGRLAARDLPGTAADVAYAWDNRGLQLSARFSASGRGIANGWDNAGRLVSTSSDMDGTARPLAFQYDADGNRIAILGTAGLSDYSAAFDYDGLDRFADYREAGGPVAATVGYDLLGRRSSLGLGLGSVTSSVAYGYDGAGRLATLGRDLAGTASDQNVAFAYDPAGEIVTRTGSNDAYAFTALTPGTTAYAANGLNQMVQAGAAAPSYDANGNMISDGATTFAYDAENRLVSASGAKNATLAYDPLGRLWQVTSGGATTRFLYDGDRALIEYDGAGSLLRSYVHGPGADEPLVWYEVAPGGVSRRFLHADERGSIAAVADAGGTALGLNRYDEYGVPAASNLGRFQYTGQKWIGELGLYDYKARLYDPGKGRFMQVDPIGYEGGINLYAYVGDDPVDKTDPLGQREPETQTKWRIGGIITAVAKRAGPIGVGLGLAKLLHQVTPEPHRTGTIAYRVYDDKKAPLQGSSWTPYKPTQYANEEAMRQALALPPSWGNTAQRVATGYIKVENIEKEQPTTKQIDPVTHRIYEGGAVEIVVRNPKEVRIIETEPMTYQGEKGGNK